MLTGLGGLSDQDLAWLYSNACRCPDIKSPMYAPPHNKTEIGRLEVFPSVIFPRIVVMIVVMNVENVKMFRQLRYCLVSYLWICCWALVTMLYLSIY